MRKQLKQLPQWVSGRQEERRAEAPARPSIDNEVVLAAEQKAAEVRVGKGGGGTSSKWVTASARYRRMLAQAAADFYQNPATLVSYCAEFRCLYSLHATCKLRELSCALSEYL